METQHADTVVEKVTAFVKDIFGVPTAEPTPDVVANPDYVDTNPLGLDDRAPKMTATNPEPAIGETSHSPFADPEKSGAPLDPEDMKFIRGVERE